MWFSTAPNSHSLCLILMFLALGRISQCSAVGRGVPQRVSNSTSSTTSSVAHSSSEHSSTLQTLYEIETKTISPLPSTSSFIPGAAGVQPTTSTRGTTTASSKSSSGDTSTITPGPASSTYQYPWGNQTIPLNTCSFVAPEGDIEYSPCHVSAGEVKLSYFPEDNDNTTYPSTYYAADLGVTMTSPLIYMLINTITGDNNCGPLGPTYSNKVISMNITDVSTLPPYADATANERIGGQERPLTLSDLLNCPSINAPPASSVLTDPHPISDTYNRCNPRLVFPHQASAIGYPYWVHCGADNYRVGIFDPPGAVPPVNNLLPTTAAIPYTSTYESPSAAPAVTAPAASTSSINSPAAPITVLVASTSPGNQPEVTQVDSVSTRPTAPATTQSTIDVTDSSDSDTSISTAITPGSESGTPSTSNPPSLASAIAVSMPKPTPAQTAIATLASGKVISAFPGASTLDINGQTITAGGSVITLAGSDDVATLDPSKGLIVEYASGTVSTYSAPAPAPTTVEAIVIATVNGLTISAAPGASTLVIGTQTLSVDGPVMTIADSNVVVTLDISQLVVVYPSSTVSVYALPTGVGNAVTPGGAIALEVATANETPAVVIGSQTVSLGGPVITLSNNDVVTFGSSGLGVQMPGGGINTMTLPTSVSPTLNTTGQGLGNIIASFAGISTSTSLLNEIISQTTLSETTTPAATSSSNDITGTSLNGTNTTLPTKATIETSSKGTSSRTASSSVASVTAVGAGNRTNLGCVNKWGLLGVMMGLMYGF